MKYKTLVGIFIFLLIYVLFYMIEFNETYIDSIKKRTIEKDGFCVLYNPQYVINNAYKNDVLHQLPPDYVFIDYVYKINNVALSTFHRDVTSSQHNYNTDYPVYTAILYKYSGDLLSICPNSNQDYPLCFSHIYNISGEPGTVFLFDCDTLHAGQINNCKEREVIQFKICHKTDLSKLKHLQGINTEKTDICTMSYYNSIMRKLSYYFEFPINYMFYPIMIKRENKNNLIGFIQNFIPLSYYNNSY